MSVNVKFLIEGIEQYQVLALRSDNRMCCPSDLDEMNQAKCVECKLYKTCNESFEEYLPVEMGEITQEEIEHLQELHPEYFI